VWEVVPVLACVGVGFFVVFHWLVYHLFVGNSVVMVYLLMLHS
jgi:hypothetical protein